jgi:hypothetical protein
MGLVALSTQEGRDVAGRGAQRDEVEVRVRARQRGRRVARRSDADRDAAEQAQRNALLLGAGEQAPSLVNDVGLDDRSLRPDIRRWDDV